MPTPQKAVALIVSDDDSQVVREPTLIISDEPVIIGNPTFPEFEVAKVDPSGNNLTGRVGDISKPFLTVQGAINAIQSGSFNAPLIDVGNNLLSENVTTSLDFIAFGGIYEGQSTPFSKLTFTNSGNISVLSIGSQLTSLTCSSLSLNISLFGGGLGDATNNGGTLSVFSGISHGNVYGTLKASGSIFIYDLISSQNTITIDSPGSNVFAYWSRIQDVIHANNVTLQDSRITGTNSSSGTTTYSPIMFLPVQVSARRVTAQSSANSNITRYTVGGSDSSFQVSMNMNVVSAVAISTSLNCGYTDENGTARTMILPVTSLSGSFLAGGLVTTTGAFETPAMHIRCQSGSTITLYTATGTFTTVNYNAEGIITQTQ